MRPLVVVLALLMAPADALAAGELTWPVRGEVITEYRNGADPYSAGQHRGIDVVAPVGAPVVAAAAGTIEYAGPVGSAGLTVSQRTADGRLQLSYLHLSRIAVRRGASVAAGERIGEVGVSGERSDDRPHLHFGVRLAGDRHAYLDPLGLLGPSPAEPPQPQPRPLPVPAPSGAPVRTEPVPAAPPAAAPVAAPVPAPGPLPAVRPGLALGPAPAMAAPAAARRLDGIAQAAGAAAATDAAAPAAPATRDDAAGARPAAPGAGPQAAEREAYRPETERSSPASGRSGGFDAGWLAACLGLVAAAGLLAGPRGARRGYAPVRTAFGALLRAAARG